MTAQETEFLKDQVERLNALLEKYQEQYSLSFQPDGVEVSRPWLTNRKALSPLIREYDVVLQQLEGEANEYKGQILSLKQQLEEIISENDRLRMELKDGIQQQIGAAERSVYSNVSGTADTSSIISNLQQQLRLALQEKEACQDRWREAAQELDRLEAELQAQRDSHQWKSIEKQAHEVKEQYARSVAVLNTELETLHSDLRQVRQEFASSQKQLIEMKKANQSLQQQLAWKDEEKAEIFFKEGINDSKMAELQRIMEEYRQRVSNANREMDELRREKSVMEARISELLRRLSETEQRENEAIQQRRKAEALAETSMLEKDQAEIQARHREEEVSHLQDSIAKIINEAGVRTRQEVDSVRKQCNERVTKLTEELHNLEMEKTEMQSQLDRLLREKRAIESELQKSSKETKLEGSRIKESIEELNRRLSSAERSRDELLLKTENMQLSLDRERDETQQQKESYESKVQLLQQRLSALQQLYEQTKEEQLKNADSLNTLTKKLQQAEQERDSAHRKFIKELALVEQNQQTKTRGFEVQLQSTEDARRTSVTELRKLLTAQQRMSARWKEECHSIAHKFEGKIEEMREETSHLRKRNDQLTNLLKESQSKTADAERIMSEYTRNIHRMEARLQKAEKYAADASRQMFKHHTKERQLMSERQSLINELSRSQRELNQDLANESVSNGHHKSALVLEDFNSSR